MALALRETPRPQTTSPPHHMAVSRLGLHKRFPEDCGFRPAGPWPPGYGKLWLGASVAAAPHPCPRREGWVLTHVELPHEAGHVVVLEVLGQHLLGKLALVEHVEAVPALLGDTLQSHVPPAREARPERWAAHIPSRGGGWWWWR